MKHYAVANINKKEDRHCQGSKNTYVHATYVVLVLELASEQYSISQLALSYILIYISILLSPPLPQLEDVMTPLLEIPSMKCQ